MFPASWQSLPSWVAPAVATLAALAVTWLVGELFRRVFCRNLSAWAQQTSWEWDDLLIDALRRGTPVWSLLAGLYFSVGFWNLPEHFHAFLSRAAYVLLWLSITVTASGAAGRIVMFYGRQAHGALPATGVIENLVKILIISLGGLMVLNGLGVSVAPILTALGVGGLAVALALQDTLASLFAGFYLTMSREVRVGDYVKLEGGQEGYIEDIGWRATRIRMLANNAILIPNKRFAESIVTNFEFPSQDLAVLVEVGVAYGSDLEHVERVTMEVGREIMQQVAGGVPSFEPFIRFHTLGEYSVNFTTILRAKTFVDQYLVKHEFVKRLHRRYAQEDITIPFPTRTMLTEAGER